MTLDPNVSLGDIAVAASVVGAFCLWLWRKGSDNQAGQDRSQAILDRLDAFEKFFNLKFEHSSEIHERQDRCIVDIYRRLNEDADRRSVPRVQAGE